MQKLLEIKKGIMDLGDSEIGIYEGDSGRELFILDMDEAIEHAQELEDKHIRILEDYSLIDENQFTKNIKNILDSYDTITNDKGLSEEIVLDILETLEIGNEESRKTIS